MMTTQRERERETDAEITKGAGVELPYSRFLRASTGRGWGQNQGWGLILFPYSWVTSPPLTHTMKNMFQGWTTDLKTSQLKPNTLRLAESAFLYTDLGDQARLILIPFSICCFLPPTEKDSQSLAVFLPVKTRWGLIQPDGESDDWSREGEHHTSDITEQVPCCGEVGHFYWKQLWDLMLQEVFSCRIFGHGNLFWYKSYFLYSSFKTGL